MKKRMIRSLLLSSILLLALPIHPKAADELPVSEEQQADFISYDIPLDQELQRFIADKCHETGMPMELVLALIETESSYRTDVISKTNDYGLMQINKCNHSWLKRELGLDNLLDPKQNITAGMYILNQHLEAYGDQHKALMAYNMGTGTASKLWKQGIYESKYSRKVIKAAEEIKGRR